MARPGTVVLALTLAGIGCARGHADAPPVEQPSAEAEQGPGPEVLGHTFKSTEKNEEFEGQKFDDDPLVKTDYGDVAISTVEEAREYAEATIEPELNPRQTWKTSPILPVSWPVNGDKQVKFLFYPMAANPHSMSHYQLFSAAYAVTVSLQDGTAQIEKLKTRKLGTVEDKRPSVLERNELELAERSLVHVLLGGEVEGGENSFWGYLKFFHEHPKFAADMKKQSPKFVAWLNSKRKRRR